MPGMNHDDNDIKGQGEMTGCDRPVPVIETADRLSHLIEDLTTATPARRKKAAIELGRIGGDKAAVALASVLKDRWGQRADVRIAALQALGEIYSAGRYARTLACYLDGESYKVVNAARRMLRRLDPERFPTLLASSGAVDHSAMRIYGEYGEKDALPVISAYIETVLSEGLIGSSQSWGKVYAAARALGKIRSPSSVATLERILSATGRCLSGKPDPLVSGRLRKIEAAARSSLEKLGEKVVSEE